MLRPQKLKFIHSSVCSFLLEPVELAVIAGAGYTWVSRPACEEKGAPSLRPTQTFIGFLWSANSLRLKAKVRNLEFCAKASQVFLFHLLHVFSCLLYLWMFLSNVLTFAILIYLLYDTVS